MIQLPLGILTEKPGNEEEQKFWEKEVAENGVIKYMAACCRTEVDYSTQTTVFFRKFIGYQQGICLGGNLSEQRLLVFDDLSYLEQTRKEKPGVGYLKAGREAGTLCLKLPFFERREDDDNDRRGGPGT